MANETWAVLFGTNAVAFSAGPLGVRPGLGRHRLTIPIELRPTADVAHGHSFSIGGWIEATRLAGGGGYLGHVSPHPTETAASELADRGLLRRRRRAESDRSH